MDLRSIYHGSPLLDSIIKNDIEFILMQRKPGGYRKPTEEQRRLSMISKEEYGEWFRQFWNITGASTRNHPAPFPLELAYRLVRMFSFWGDTVLDPFAGTGTTLLAAEKASRNSIGIEIDENYCCMALKRFHTESSSLFSGKRPTYHRTVEQEGRIGIAEEPSSYGTRRRKPHP